LLDFFTDPYKDELIYSTIARYHYYSGNLELKDTIEECFGKRTIIATLELGGNFDYLSKALGKKYNSESLIAEHTLMPYYAPFIDEKIKNEIIEVMMYEGSNSIYTKLGIIAGGICKKDSIFYCPICAAKDIEENGEAYIHREHQLEGIILCSKHGMLLKKYPLRRTDVSRIEYIRFEEKYLNLKDENIQVEYYDKHLRLSKASYCLLDTNLNHVCREKVFRRYRYLLYKNGFLKGNNTVNQRKLYEEFISYYGKEFLRQLDSEIDYGNEYNWLKVISRKSKRTSHPLRHLLFINFLCKDVAEFFNEINKYKIKKVENEKHVYLVENANLGRVRNYRAAILNLMSNSSISRTTIRNQCKKEYIYLYRYDREWLFKNLPVKTKVILDNQRIDWNKRDKEYLKLLKKKYEELIKDTSMIRITKGSLAKPLGILANIEKKLELLPLTKKFFEEVCESVEAFEIRRAKAVIDSQINFEPGNIKMWKVQRIAGIRSKQFRKIKDELQSYLVEKQVKNKLWEKEKNLS
jgi:hypothetical protein